MKPEKSILVKRVIPFVVCAGFFSGCSSSNDSAAIDSVAEVNAGDAIVEIDPNSVDASINPQGSIEIEPVVEVEPVVAVEPVVPQEPPSSVMDSLDNTEAPGAADLLPSASCDGLLHPNGLTYCVDESTRLFSATQADGTVLFSFVLPGDNSNNQIIAIVPINDNVALIANKAPGIPENPLYIENDRFEISFFEPGGRFIDTHRLLLVPFNGRYVAICGDSERCVEGLGTHEFDRNPDSDEWSLVRFVINSAPVSDAVITADNFGQLIEIIDEISDGQPLVQPIRDRVDEVTAGLDSLMQLPTATESAALTLHECPLGGTTQRVGNDTSTQNIFDYSLCQFPAFRLNGILDVVSSQGTSTTYDQLELLEGDTETVASGAFVTSGGGGLFATTSFNLSDFVRSTSERTLAISEFEYFRTRGSSTSSFQSFPPNAFNGWSGVTPDGRTGTVRSSGTSTNALNLSYSIEDSSFAEIPLFVSIRLEDIRERLWFELDEGGVITDQDITILLTTPDGSSQFDVMFEFRDGCDDVCGRGWSGGDISVLPRINSRLQISPVGGGSALGRLNVFTDSGPLPAQSVLIDLTLIFGP